MQIYLPIAEITVDPFVIVFLGAAVGFLSGMPIRSNPNSTASSGGRKTGNFIVLDPAPFIPQGSDEMTPVAACQRRPERPLKTGDYRVPVSPERRRDDYRYFTPIQTRWMDNDVYQHVNNVTYYSYFDTVVNGYLIEAGALDIEKSPVIGLVVETGCRYFAPAAFPDRLEGGLCVAKIGTSSVRYEVGIFQDGDAAP